MKVFALNLKKYFSYSMYSARCGIKSEVAGSSLQFVWLILEPFLMMMVYAFISIIVFSSKEPNFVVMVFIGQGTWSFTNKTVNEAINLVRKNKSIVSRVYIPKYMLVVTSILENLFNYSISMGLSLLVAIPFGVRLKWTLTFVPIIATVMCTVGFGVGCLLMHLGVYLKDTKKIMHIVMRLLFYMSGIFYSIPSRVPAPYSTFLLSVNPAAMLINETRNVFIYGKLPNFVLLGA